MMNGHKLVRAVLAGLLLGAVAAGTATPATPAAAGSEPLLVAASSDYDSVKQKEALAQCPRGTRVLGGGGYVHNGGRQVHLTRLQALGSSNRFAAGATEFGGFTANWRVSAYAICGPAPSGLEYVSRSTKRDSTSPKSAFASCSSGKKAVSMGARVYGGNGDVAITDIGIHNNNPNGAINVATVAGAEEHENITAEWTLWSFAVCADPLPGLEHVVSPPVYQSEDKSVVAECPPGKRLYGVGASMWGKALVHAIHRGIYPDQDLKFATDIVLETPSGEPEDWGAQTQAMCAY